MHNLQATILKRLALKPNFRFSDIKPHGIESNQFMYHLHKVIDEGYVKKVGNQYKLSPAGKRYVDRMSFEQGFKERIQPKIVTLIACNNKKGEYIMYKRSRQPFFGLIGLPYGKIHLGERVEEAAGREFKEKVGLEINLKHRGDVYVTVHDEEDLITQMLCHVFSGTCNLEIPIVDSINRNSFWINPSKLKREDQIPGFNEVLKLIKTKKSFFFEEYFLDIHEV